MNQDQLTHIISELEVQVKELIQVNTNLKAENHQLKKDLDSKPTQNDDLFQHLDTTKRMALKAKVDHLLHKIDNQLNKGEEA